MSLSLKGVGSDVRPSCHSSAGISPGFSGRKVKLCTRAVKKRNSSVLARASPRHCRLPVEKGMKCSSRLSWPLALRKR